MPRRMFPRHIWRYDQWWVLEHGQWRGSGLSWGCMCPLIAMLLLIIPVIQYSLWQLLEGWAWKKSFSSYTTFYSINHHLSCLSYIFLKCIHSADSWCPSQPFMLLSYTVFTSFYVFFALAWITTMDYSSSLQTQNISSNSYCTSCLHSLLTPFNLVILCPVQVAHQYTVSLSGFMECWLMAGTKLKCMMSGYSPKEIKLISLLWSQKFIDVVI